MGNNSCMTIILSTITRDYVVQVVDRRLTDTITRELCDDDATKAVLFHGHIAWAYTGLSKLPQPHLSAESPLNPLDTNLWLGEVLKRATTAQEAIDFIQAEAALAVAKQLHVYPSGFPLAFIGVGWMDDGRLDDDADGG